MRTTLDLDRDLLERAKSVLGAATFTAAIERSLSAAIERAELDAALDSLRGSDAVWGVEDSLGLRRIARDRTS